MKDGAAEKIEDLEDPMLDEPAIEENIQSFGGLAGELSDLIQKMNSLPDLLLFIDNTADNSYLVDKDSLVQQRFINEIINEAKGIKTP